MGIAMRRAISMLQSDPNRGRNKRIIVITDASPTIGVDVEVLKQETEQVFVESNGMIGVTCVGIGLSFDAAVSLELSRVHSTTIVSISTSRELEELLTKRFNYCVSPIAFDLRIGINDPIDRVCGGEDDPLKEGNLMEFRTMTASSVDAAGVKDSVLIVRLKSVGGHVHQNVKISLDYHPFGETADRYQEYEIPLRDERDPIVQKGFVLSVYYETMRELLSEAGVRKELFDRSESAQLRKLRAFPVDQPPDMSPDLVVEIELID
jgi:hypothetical protein